MFFVQLLLIFVVVPAAMIGVSVATGPSGARVVAYVAFPIALLAFAVIHHVRSGRREGGEP